MGDKIFKVLLVEDSEECQLLVKKSLSKSKVEITSAFTIAEAHRYIDSLVSSSIDLVLLDLALPDGDGLELLKHLHTHEFLSSAPIFLLTSNEDLSSKITAFGFGAEDYLVKPVNPLELKARVEMRLRKTTLNKKNLEMVQKGRLTLDLSVMKASIRMGTHDQTLELTAKEYKILSFLIQNEGTVFSRSELVKNIWGNKIHVLDRTVDSHVCGLRKKLMEYSGCVESVPGAGYRFVLTKA